MPASPPAKIVFMGAPAFALPALEALVGSHHRVIAVYTQPPRPANRGQQETPTPVHRFAQEKNIPVYTPRSLKDPAIQAEFAALNADIGVVAAYGLILPQAVLDAPKRGCLNIHPSLLPRWRGAAPLQRTLMAGDTETGVCIMQMDVGLDTGDVLMREHFSIPSTMDAGGLHDALANIGARLLLKTIDQLDSLIPEKQSEQGVTYAQKIQREDCKLDWNLSAETLHHHVRGLSPFPGAFCLLAGEQIKVFSTRFEPRDSGKSPGTVVDEAFGIACGSGVLYPQELQKAGKRRMTTEEFLRGTPVSPGTTLD